MLPIQMVDLKTQYDRIKKEIDEAITNVIDNTAFINGPEVKTFGKELSTYLDAGYVIPCGNGTDALQVAMMALNLKPGDEVITPDFTFVATVEVIALLGLKPVLVDVDRETFNISPEAVEAAITEKTKAIVPVHLFGQCADMDKITDIAHRHNLYIIEDTAQAMGAEHYSADGTTRKAGTIGHVGCTSFFPSKNLACYGDGGAIITNDEELAGKLKAIVNHGSKIKYYHHMIGVNSRLDTLQAAILRVKLKYLDEFNASRQKVASYYDTVFKDISGIETPVRSSFSSHVFHQYTLKLSGIDREELKKYLQEHHVPAMVYYPVPMHLQEAYKSPEYHAGDFPVTEELCKTVLSLPIHTEMDKEQLEYITGTILKFING